MPSTMHWLPNASATWVMMLSSLMAAVLMAAQEIRNEEITREEGVALCKRYDGEFPTRFEQEIWDYLSLDERHFPHAGRLFEQPAMDREYFMHLADRFRSPHIWMYRNGRWELRHKPFEGDSECNYGVPAEKR